MIYFRKYLLLPVNKYCKCQLLQTNLYIPIVKVSGIKPDVMCVYLLHQGAVKKITFEENHPVFIFQYIIL